MSVLLVLNQLPVSAAGREKKNNIEEARAALYELLEDSGSTETDPDRERLEKLMAGESIAISDGSKSGSRDIMAVVYQSDRYMLRQGPGQEYGEVLPLGSGQTVFIEDVALSQDNIVWDLVRTYWGETEYKGYIERDYLICTDERFLAWEKQWDLGPQGENRKYSLSVSGGDVVSSFGDEINQFPESYREGLDALKEKHPLWHFVPIYTKLDWNTVLDNELSGGKSLVHKSLADCTKEGAYDQGNWYYASREILAYYMDPRNSFTESGIFQFEQLTYNPSYHTKEALDLFLNKTFMNGSTPAPGMDAMTYSDIFYAISTEKGFEVSPFHLAARVYQEQGQGKSALISGTYPGYEGLYNYFNIGATGTTNEQVIVSGLTYARNAKNVYPGKENVPMPWNNAYYSILGGSHFIADKYIKKGQDTLYLQKFNVKPGAYYKPYSHQYMQNISAPSSEGKKMKEMYEAVGALDNEFVFAIPVYEKMPAKACPKPAATDKIVLKVPEGYDNQRIYIDGNAYKPAKQNGSYTVIKSPGTKVKTAVAYGYNEKGIPNSMYVWTLQYIDGSYRVTAREELENLISYHGFSIRITGKSGIRFKAGIDAAARENLVQNGVDGYKLKEYGSILMTRSNMDKLPMIKDGEKTKCGVAFAVTDGAVSVDNVYETKDGRYRFTSVLVGLPAEQYKTEFAFRGYAVLEKDGQQITVYGPTYVRSIYDLAGQVLEAGIYQEGSDADRFLKQILEQAQ